MERMDRPAGHLFDRAGSGDSHVSADSVGSALSPQDAFTRTTSAPEAGPARPNGKKLRPPKKRGARLSRAAQARDEPSGQTALDGFGRTCSAPTTATEKQAVLVPKGVYAGAK